MDVLDADQKEIVMGILTERGIEPDAIEFRENRIRIKNTNELLLYNKAWLDRPGFLADLMHRLCNIHEGIENEWTVIEGTGHEGFLFYDLMNYIVRPKDVVMERLVTYGQVASYTYVSLIKNQITVQTSSNAGNGWDDEHAEWLSEQEKWPAFIHTIGDLIELDDPTVNIIKPFKCSYKGESIRIYAEQDAILLKFLGWACMPLSQLEKKLSHFPESIQHEYNLWKAVLST